MEQSLTVRVRPDDLGARRIAASSCQLVASLTGSEVRCKAGRVRAEAWEAQFPERDASVPRRQSSRASTHHLYGDAVPRAGRPHVEPTDVYSCPSQEGGYSARGARKGESKEGGAFRRVSPSARPPTKHAVWRRVPRLAMEASGSDTRSAQHLTPLRGRPLPVWEEAMEREGAKAHVQGPELRRGPVPTGPKTRPPRSHQMAT